MSLSLIGIIRKLPTSLIIQTNLMLWLNNTGKGFLCKLGIHSPRRTATNKYLWYSPTEWKNEDRVRVEDRVRD